MSPNPNNGGVRMFPGKAAAVDAFEADRRKVDLVATVNPVVAGCTVYFRVWDVDDPFDQNNAAMPNVNLIDADTSGPDNRPAGAADSGVGQWQAVTDANGVARVTIEVSMQPGNNYRAGASLMLNGVDDATVTQADADANMPPFGVTFSDMLTIWRKLNLEVDTMSSEPTAWQDRLLSFEAAAVDVTLVLHGNPGPDFTTFFADSWPFPSTFEGGGLRCLACCCEPGEFLIVRHEGNEFITFGSPMIAFTDTIIVRDDDPIGTPLQLPQPVGATVTPELLTAYAAAYIDVAEIPLTINTDRIQPWESEIGDLEFQLDILTGTGVRSTRNVDGTSTYWARHLVAIYQEDTVADWDADPYDNCAISENCLLPNVPYDVLALPPLVGTDSAADFGVTSHPSIVAGTSTSLVPKETVRDNAPISGAVFWQFVAHEVGHDTVPRVSAATEHSEGGLMTVGGLLTGSIVDFTAPTIARFRSAERF